MLQQMSSPPSAQVGEVVSLVRPFEGRLNGDVSSEASSDAAEESELPQCKIRRNYNCAKCTFYTQNPRAYLVHIRDVHFEKIKIYDCPHCVYASRHHQKLSRHIKMVHVAPNSASNDKVEEVQPPISDTTEPLERIEDLLEEVEECEDADMEGEDCNEETFTRTTDAEVEGDRSSSNNINQSDATKNKNKYFSCVKCNYVTHIRARFTKHVKYHSMPMIKCAICDFRTPYKWNLDRHMKNHGGSGSFTCFMCNFTADIKQSLTVHEMNHHTPPVGQSVVIRRRNRVGASDVPVDNISMFITKEEEGSGDSRSSHSASDLLQYAEKEMISCNSDSNDTEMTVKRDIEDVQNQHSPDAATDEAKYQKQSRKIPRPIPQLIPLNSSTPNQSKACSGEPPAKKFKESATESNDSVSSKFENLPADITLIPVTNTSTATKDTIVRKKNESFFDKLKERLLAETGEEGSLICKNCGFESKCLSEHSVHEKNCSSQLNRIATNTLHSTLGSTRCQNCRHRCKSSADLYIHMQTCRKNQKRDEQFMDIKNKEDSQTTISTQEKDAEPHPMENVVFVWNNINHDPNKFDTPLGININDDSTLPEPNRNYDTEIVDDNEGMNLSPSQAVGKKVFKCPHCEFWASTASRFHVHIVGHLNKKPFECSLCKYKSNWRWDITKHIKLKSARDPEHNEAKVLMTDETGRRNYSKYNKFLAMSILNENGENEFHYLDINALTDPSMDVDESFNDGSENMNGSVSLDMQPLNLQTQHGDQRLQSIDSKISDSKKPKKTMWKCKKCNYRDPSKEALLDHVREHSKADGNSEESKLMKKPDNLPDPADLAYRCGHCNQLSNWKHVIQRHCRLKHDGVIRVITTIKPKSDTTSTNDITNDTCTKCPFKTNDKKMLAAHLQQHQPSAQSIFKCYFCPFFVKDEQELVQHLLLHGVTEPEEYISKAMGCKSPLPELQGATSTPNSTKRHRCTECPYETNSKSQFMYHEQFHRLPADTPYKCPQCNYSVSKRHLLHQHLRVHGILTKKSESEAELEAMSTNSSRTEDKTDAYVPLEEIPYVWVSAKNMFHKMYKCRYCSYVNSQKCKIPYHEKIHCIIFENSEITVYKCLECKFICDNAIKLAEHSKTHGEIYGRICCPVELDIPDDEQIEKLRKVIEAEQTAPTKDFIKEDDISNGSKEVKMLYFCQKCPSRFFSYDDLKNHDKFHESSFPNTCKSCDFSAPEESELTSHTFVHSDEYHTKTKMLKFMHNSHAAYSQPQLKLIHCATTSEITWVVSDSDKEHDNISNNKKINEPKQYLCKECPAKFFKSSALSYHMGLHGGDGEHKCKKCNYAVKSIGNLAKHEWLHKAENKIPTCDYESSEDMDYKNIPLSGTDLFQRKTEAQKRVLIDKDKLVKPNDHFPPVLQADPQFGYLMHGNPEFIYPTYLKNGRQKEKRYKCHKCPSAFEKREQYKIHLSLHGSKQRYKCELCDYSVKYYANYVQHMRKHQMNDEAQAERKKGNHDFNEGGSHEDKQDDSGDNIKLAIKTMPKGTARSDFQQFSISDQQTLRLLQRRRSINSAGKDSNPSETAPTKDRKLHMCLLCPYTNQRQDALTNHYRRHDDSDILNAGSHKCSYCDLVVVQSHFLREHLKTHFNYQKTLTPECFVANEGVSFTITKVDDENISSDLKLDLKHKIDVSNEEKIFVKIKTGEVFAE
ncbi:zinc finger protein 91-like isoform X1 [Galleria mellonella]|uniref:Zinc finger protein 91-like isoform X1 n=2 Tax=Galleria mellonella TaxID=7137 RepID=A0A6J1WX30_GALME|nr:zinc finger protein 91-like isoform X1 [Galleria mellonella]